MSVYLHFIYSWHDNTKSAGKVVEHFLYEICETAPYEIPYFLFCEYPFGE